MIWRGLLVSVRDAAEADAALAGGAAIIDVKEPRRGSLGAADAEAIVAVAGVVGQRVPWTMACGELSEMEFEVASKPREHLLVRVLQRLDGRGVPPAAVKVGFGGAAGTPWERRGADLFAALPAGPERVAVAYADWERAAAPDPAAVIAAAGRFGCTTLLVDTFDKSSAGMFGCCPREAPAEWVAAARVAGLQVAIAGKIAMEEIPRAWSLGADVVAVRSAVCFNGRQGAVRADLVRRAVGLSGREVVAAGPQHLSAGVRT